EKNDDFRLAHQKRVRHVLVDEYQDTNVVQHRLLKATSLEKSTLAIDSVCAVGDEDQSIYSWRGATVANMLNFSRDFTNTQTITIEQNYRSAQEVLDLANHVINHNTLRTQRTLHSTTKQVDALRLVQ